MLFNYVYCNLITIYSLVVFYLYNFGQVLCYYMTVDVNKLMGVNWHLRNWVETTLSCPPHSFNDAVIVTPVMRFGADILETYWNV